MRITILRSKEMKKNTFYQEKRKGKLHLISPLQQKMYDAVVEGYKDGTLIEMTLKKSRPEKTNAQLGYYYGVLVPFAVEELREAGHDELFSIAVGNMETGVETNKDTVDLLFKTLFRAHKSLKHLPLKRSMTDEEMSQLIDFTLIWLAKNLGVAAPEPTKDGG